MCHSNQGILNGYLSTFIPSLQKEKNSASSSMSDLTQVSEITDTSSVGKSGGEDWVICVLGITCV